MYILIYTCSEQVKKLLLHASTIQFELGLWMLEVAHWNLAGRGC